MKIVHVRILEAINQGEDLAELLNGLFRNEARCRDMLGPALGTLSDCYRAARDAGHIQIQTDPELNEFMAGTLERILFELNISVNTNTPLASRQITALVAAINTCRKAGFRWFTPTQSTPPTPVSVVEMPRRITTTEVKRDPKTNAITGSVQTEMDSV